MIDKNIDNNINKIKEDFTSSIDLSFRDIEFNKTKITICYNQSICDEDLINNYILKNISNLNKNNISSNIIDLFYNTIPSNNVKKITSLKDVYNDIFNAFAIIFVDKYNSCIGVHCKKNLSPPIEQPKIEQTISGPKDSFNENYLINMGLIRKRIKTPNLVFDEKVLGKESKTKVSVIYMKNIIETDLLKEINKKLDNIDIDIIMDSTYIKEYIESKNAVFSLIASTERPDVACMNLLNGKVCILVENSPSVLIIPTFFIELFNSPEDYYQKSKNVTFTRIVRFLSFFIAILLPAFYIAITTFNHETIPNTLLINFAMQREGVPFPAFVEAIGMGLIFEILRESDIRMPSLSGSAVSILGAIVLGDAAVAAGVVSPIMVIVIAISAICGLMFSGPSMTNGIRFWRIIFMIFATILGIPGIIFSSFLFIIFMNDLKSFGKPYLYPLSPLNFKLLINSIFKFDIKKNKSRNPLLTDTNYKRSEKK